MHSVRIVLKKIKKNTFPTRILFLIKYTLLFKQEANLLLQMFFAKWWNVQSCTSNWILKFSLSMLGKKKLLGSSMHYITRGGTQIHEGEAMHFISEDWNTSCSVGLWCYSYANNIPFPPSAQYIGIKRHNLLTLCRTLPVQNTDQLSFSFQG